MQIGAVVLKWAVEFSGLAWLHMRETKLLTLSLVEATCAQNRSEL